MVFLKIFICFPSCSNLAVKLVGDRRTFLRSNVRQTFYVQIFYSHGLPGHLLKLHLLMMMMTMIIVLFHLFLLRVSASFRNRDDDDGDHNNNNSNNNNNTSSVDVIFPPAGRSNDGKFPLDVAVKALDGAVVLGDGPPGG